MRFHHQDKVEKTILVISDIHLGAGEFLNSKKNYLEDFVFDTELVDFLNYYSENEYKEKNVDLIINGDLFDLLAVPYVEFFDDEFWTEKASLEKLKLIINGHPEVVEALIKFCGTSGKKIFYQLGNHDAELIFNSLQEYLYSLFPLESRKNFKILEFNSFGFSPIKEMMIKHGHEYEFAHTIDSNKSFYVDENNQNVFIPPWGSYYVSRVLNKFKRERHYINAIRPVRHFLIWGLVYDTLFTLRFIFSNAFYFFMVRMNYLFRKGSKFKEIFREAKKELSLFYDLENETENYFQDNPLIKILIVGHTHLPVIKNFPNNSYLINTGSWTRMHFLDWERVGRGQNPTFAQIDVLKDMEKHLDVSLKVWKGKNNLPFTEY